MLMEARLDRILELITERGQVTVTELNADLRVSDATVRRDLDRLARLGHIRRARGGAVRAGAIDREPPLELRENELRDEKERIAVEAARTIRTGTHLFLSSGTTVAAVTPHLCNVGDLTVITNSLPVINQLAGRSDVELIVVGGMFRHTERSMVSQFAERMIAEFRVDTVFMGARAIDADHGVTADSVAEACTDRAILKIARERVILADHTKFGRVSTVAVGPLDQVDKIITDRIDADDASLISQQGPVVVAAT